MSNLKHAISFARLSSTLSQSELLKYVSHLITTNGAGVFISAMFPMVVNNKQDIDFVVGLKNIIQSRPSKPIMDNNTMDNNTMDIDDDDNIDIESSESTNMAQTLPVESLNGITQYLHYEDIISFGLCSRNTYIAQHTPLSINYFNMKYWKKLCQYVDKTGDFHRFNYIIHHVNNVDIKFSNDVNQFAMYDQMLPSILKAASKSIKLKLWSSVNKYMDQILNAAQNVKDLEIGLETLHDDDTKYEILPLLHKLSLQRLAISGGTASERIYLLTPLNVSKIPSIACTFNIDTLSHIADILEQLNIKQQKIQIEFGHVMVENQDMNQIKNKAVFYRDLIWNAGNRDNVKVIMLRLNNVYKEVMIGDATDGTSILFGHKCQYTKCGLIFESKVLLKKHVKDTHDAKIPNRICDECGKLSSNKGNHEKHQNMH